ncbi:MULTISPECIES: glutaredoxin family protein [unclassified Janthinobacterium]|uniref:glutaredoxin family protein n=1 Tax=unclassified Janthinobacterium TaxID=2610881 RepID=UPI0003494D38|nr:MULTISPECIES: glutaredoxin family protein [unclassified Janthinobacterium]
MAGYGLIVALGLGAGYGLSLLPAALKPAYTEGDYAAYFPDKNVKVVLYGTTRCGFCAKARAHFAENNIPFTDLDIDQSPQAKSEFAKLGGGGVPLLLIGNRRIQGFNPGAIGAALKKLSD